jgi:curved DNA-binding protein CbpA
MPLPVSPPRVVVNHYEVLGVVEKASDVEIKKAHKQQSWKWHPDRIPKEAEEKVKEEAEKKFKAIQTAYQVLSHPGKRAKFDKQLRIEKLLRQLRIESLLRRKPPAPSHSGAYKKNLRNVAHRSTPIPVDKMLRHVADKLDPQGRIIQAVTYIIFGERSDGKKRHKS